MHKSPVYETLDHNRIIKMYLDEKKSDRVIGEALGVSTYTIKKVLIRYNVPFRTRSESQRIRYNSAKKPVHKADVIRLYYDQQLPMKKVAKTIGVSESTVRECMDKWGMERRTKSEVLEKWHELPADEIATLYLDKQESIKQIADYYDVSDGIILKVLKNAGVKRRSISEAQKIAHRRRKLKRIEAFTPETIKPKDTDIPIADQIVSMRKDDNAKIQDIAHLLGVPTTEVFEVLTTAGVL